MWHHLYDPGYHTVSKLIYDDMQALENIGLNGMMSCQLSRAYFPTNLPMHIMAETLWDRDCDFEEKALEYYFNAFGPDGEAVMEYMKGLSENFDPTYHRSCFKKNTALYDNEERLKRLKKCQAILASFEATIKKNLEEDHCSAVRASWEYLVIHAEYCHTLLKPLFAVANGNIEERDILSEELDDFIRLLPARAHKVVDEWQLLSMAYRLTKAEVRGIMAIEY